MKTGTDRCRGAASPLTWEEQSGLLDFLAAVGTQVADFERELGLGVEIVPAPPISIDGSRAEIEKLGFLVVRNVGVMPDRTYCLYCLLRGRVLRGFIGLYADGRVSTLRELAPLAQFRRARGKIWDWLRALVKASCDKV